MDPLAFEVKIAMTQLLMQYRDGYVSFILLWKLSTAAVLGKEKGI